MSSAAITVRTDEDTKRRLTSWAESVGLSVNAFASIILKQALAEGRVVMTPPLEPTPYLEKIMREVEADIKTGRNISKAYDNAADFFADLDAEK